MVEKKSPKIRKPRNEKVKVEKNVELTNLMGSYILSDMEEGDILTPTGFRNKIVLSEGGNPHPTTVQGKLNEWATIKDVLGNVEFHKQFNQRKNTMEIKFFKRINPKEEDNQDLIKKELERLSNKLLSIEFNIQKILKKIK